MAKCVLRVTGQEDNAAYNKEQLTGGVESVIEGGIHAMRLLWSQNSQEDDWGFLLIDAWNAFNEENQIAMLWSVWHECPIDEQFTFNCYSQWDTLMMRNTKDGSGHFLNSK